ncbi:MAG: dephospho-CoA kinase [Gammaproteobacteria bacterium]|nr:dephospho-CoA kinase [Gammaproteobacteria bacterium]MYF37792.1 dephospho-CoA kinase [Gammaproteobacteria bacterium]
MYTIGLTGSIGAGKSTVARYLEHRGYPIVDADQLGHEAYEPSTSCFHKVVSAFGKDLVAPDGTINRKKLGRIVFADSVRLQLLNQIVWPEIKKLAELRLESHRQLQQFPIVFFEAAVLVEADWYTIVDEVWTVLSSKSTTISRVLARDDTSEAHLEQRIDAQISNQERIRRSQVVIHNNGSIDELHKSVDLELNKLHQRIEGDK